MVNNNNNNTTPASSKATKPVRREKLSRSKQLKTVPRTNNPWIKVTEKLSPKQQLRKRQHQHALRYQGVTPAFQDAVERYFEVGPIAPPSLTAKLERGIQKALGRPRRARKTFRPTAAEVSALLKNPIQLKNRFKGAVIENFTPLPDNGYTEIYTPKATWITFGAALGHSYDLVTEKLPGLGDLPDEAQPVVYMLNDRRPVMMESHAAQSKVAFYSQPRYEVQYGFWRYVWDRPGTYDNVLWSVNGKPLFCPRIRDGDAFAAARQLNGAVFVQRETRALNRKTLCAVNREGDDCFRPVLRGGRCKLHLTSSRVHICPRRLYGEAEPEEPVPSQIWNRFQAAKFRAQLKRRKLAQHLSLIQLVERRLEQGTWFHPGRAERPTHDVWMLHKHYETVRDRCALYQSLQVEKVMCPECKAEAGPEQIPDMIYDGRYNEAITVWNIHKKEQRARLNRPDGMPVNHWIDEYNRALNAGDSHRLDQILEIMPVCPSTSGRIARENFDSISDDFAQMRLWREAADELELSEEDLLEGESIHSVTAQGWFADLFGDIKVNVNWPDVSQINVQHVLEVPIVGKLVNALNVVNENIPWTKVLVEIAFFIAHIAAGGATVSNLFVTLAHLCYTTGLASSLADRLVKHFKDGYNAQADASDPAVIGVSAGIALIASLALDKLPDSKSMDRLIKRVGELGKFVGAASTISHTFGTSVEAIVDWLRVQLFGYSKLQERSLVHVDKWLDEVAALRKTDLEHRAAKELTLPATINSLLSRGDEIARLYDRLKVPLNQRTAFTTAMFFLNNARSIVSAHGAADRKMRACPPVIHFFGDSGCGKTTTLSLLINHLLVALGSSDPNDRARRVFWRDPTQEYWEGYQPDTLVTIYDDFGMFFDAIGSPATEAGEIIQTANTYPKSLTMAHVDLKGQVNFESKVILLTSNVAEFVHNSMSNPEALANRITLKFKQYVKPEYAITRNIKGKQVTSIDKTKMPVNDPLFAGAVLFQQVSKEDSNQTIGNPLAFDGMVQVVLREVLQSLERSAGMNAASEDHFRKLVQARVAADIADAMEPTPPVRPAQAAEDECEASTSTAPVEFLPPVRPSELVDDEKKEWTMSRIDTLKAMWDYSVRGGPRQIPAFTPEELADLETLPEPDATNAVSRPGDEYDMWYGYLGPETMSAQEYEFAKQELRKKGFPGTIVYNYFPSWTERLSDWTWLIGANPVHINVWESLRNRPLGLGEWNAMTLKGVKRRYDDPTNIELMLMTDMAKLYDHGCAVVPSKYATLWMTQTARATADVLAGRYYANKWCQRDPRRMWCLSMVRNNELPMVRPDSCSGEDHATVNGRFYFNEAVRDPTAVNTSAVAEKALWYCNAFEAFASGIMTTMSLMGLVALVNFVFSSIMYGKDVAVMNVTGGISRAMGWESPFEKQLRLQREELLSAQKAEFNLEEALVSEGAYAKGTAGAPKKNIEGAYAKGTSGAPKKNIEATTDQNATEIVSKVANNQYLIFRDITSTTGKATGTATAITGRIFMTSRHIWSALQGEFALCNSDKKQYIVNKENCRVSQPTGVHENKDIVLFEAPRQVHPHQDLTKHFITKEDAGSFTTLNRVALIGYDREGRHFRMTTNLCKASDELFQLNSAHDITYIRDVYRYGIDTQPGDCGAILVAYEPGLARKILASHSAGDEGEYSGIGCAVHRELIEELLKNLEIRWPESINDGKVPTIVTANMGGDGEAFGDRFGLPETLTPIQRLERPVFTPAKTKIVPSPVQGMIRPPTTMPALLRKTGEVDPLANAMKKVTTPTVLVDADCMERCQQDLTATTMTRINSDDLRVLTLRESIEGIVGNKFYPPINRRTSPGYGWNARQGPGKTTWLGADEYKFDHPEFLARYNAALDLLKSRKRIGIVWTDTLKDETRPIEKVKAGKTRLFSCGEMVGTVLLRQYFGGYIAHVTRNNIYNECAVGINVYGPDWERLYRHVTEVGSDGNAGDFENFDGRLGAALLWAVYDDVAAFYAGAPHDPEDDVVRQFLWMEIVNSVHVQGDVVYMWDHSQPSGCPFTSILNSRAQAIALRYVFVKMAEKYAPEKATLDQYRKHIRLVAYGDDNVIGVHPDVQSWFNYQTLAEGFALLGMVYTDETKKAATVAHKRIEDVTFLKRGFRWEDGRLYAPLSIDTIVEMPNWVCGRGGWELTGQIMEDALYELSQHDKATFDSIRSEFDRAIKAVQRVTTLNVYSQAEYRLMTDTRHWQLPVGVNRHLGVEPRVLYAQMDAPGSAAPGSSASGSMVTFGSATETAERHTITRFYHDGELLSSARATPPVPMERNTAISDGEKNSLIDIISRPIQIDGVSWPLTFTRGTNLIDISLPDKWINTASVRTKTYGFRFVRCDIEVEVQVNAQPFNAGALYMWYEPYADALQSVPTSTMSITGRTGYPNVQLFLEDGGTAKLLCPFVSNLNAYPLSSEYGFVGGTLHMEVLSQLTGQLDAEISIFLWPKNIRLEQPTQARFIPTVNAQAGEDGGEEWPVPEGAENPMNNDGAGPAPPPQVESEEKEASKPGTSLSKILSVAGKAVGVLSVVPEIGVVAGIAGGVLSLGGLIAGAFGWSKPLDHGTNQMVQIGLNRNLTNFNGDSKAKVAAVDATNKVDIPVDAFRSTKDEMAFRAMLGRELYMGEESWSVTQLAGQDIYEIPVLPDWFMDTRDVTIGGQAGTLRAQHYVGALSQLFRYWRGSLEFRFKLVKTQYHSGRLQVLWYPGQLNDTLVAPEMVYREVHDIRSKNEIVVKIPFNYFYPWASLVGPEPEYTGRLYVRVLNPLRAPTTVAQTIKVLTYMRAGDDFQFAMPRSMRQPLVAHVPKPSPPPNAQANFTEATVPDDTSVNQRGVGEAVLSARTLCRRYVDFQTNGGSVRHSQDCISANSTLAQIKSVDYISIFGMFYRMRSGGVRVLKSFTQAPGSRNKYSITREGESADYDYLSPVVYNWSTLEPTLEIAIPFYQRVEFIPTNLGEPAQSRTGYVFNLGTDLVPDGTEPNGTETLRSIGEDFNFGFLLGPPMVFQPNPPPQA